MSLKKERRKYITSDLHSDSTTVVHTHNLLYFRKVQERGKRTGSDLVIGTVLVSGLNVCKFLLSPLHRSSTAAAGWENKITMIPSFVDLLKCLSKFQTSHFISNVPVNVLFIPPNLGL